MAAKKRGRPRKRRTNKKSTAEVTDETITPDVVETVTPTENSTLVDKQALLNYLRRTEIEYVNQYAFNAYLRLITAINVDKFAPKQE